MKDYVSKLMVPVLEVDVVNKNNRFYPKELVLEKMKKWEKRIFPVVIGALDYKRLKENSFELDPDTFAGTCSLVPELVGEFLYVNVNCFNSSDGRTLQQLIETNSADFRTIVTAKYHLRTTAIYIADFTLIGISALPKGQGA